MEVLKGTLSYNDMLWTASHTERGPLEGKGDGEKTGGGKPRIQLNPQFEQSKWI